MKRITIIIFMVFARITIGQVVLDSVFVNTSFCGVMNKTLVEMYIHNPTENDSLEFIQNFSLNNNAIIENLWLEINGKLKKDTTVSRSVGTRVYNRIVRKNIDPAYLVKLNRGGYLLRVFPVNKHQTRKIVFEYYSILGEKREFTKSKSNKRHKRASVRRISTNKKNNLVWFIDFETDDTFKKSISFTSIQPINTIIDFSNISSALSLTQLNKEKTIEHKFECKKANKFYLGMNHSKTNLITKYYNDSTNCFSNNLPFEKTKKYKQSEMFNIRKNHPPTVIKSIIQKKRRKVNDTLYYNRREYVANTFLIEMLNYLTTQKQNDLDCYLIGFSDLKINSYSVIDNEALLIEKVLFLTKNRNKSNIETIELKCHFINKYFEYYNGIFSDIESQINSGFLTTHLAKIVIEDDSLSNIILTDALKSEINRDFKTPPPLPSQIIEETEPVFFCAVEKMPTLIGGLTLLKSQIYYPDLEVDSIETEKNYTVIRINDIGQVINVKTIKRKNKLLSQISRLLLSQTEWLPGKQRGKTITLSITVPMAFFNDSLVLYKERAKEKIYEIGNSVYKPTVKNGNLVLLDNKFNYLTASTIKLKSIEFYELMYNAPRLMDIIYQSFYLSNISELGIVVFDNGTKENILITNY